MVRVVIAGTGYPEIAHWSGHAKTIEGDRIEIVGFLDDNQANKSRELNGLEILGGFSYLEQMARTVRVVNSIARSTGLRRETTMKLKEYGAEFVTMIHETALVREPRIGIGTIVGPYVVAECGVTIGEHCCILAGTTIGHDSVIGDYCFAGHGTRIQGHVTVMDEVFMGSGSCIFPDIVIGESATVGINATVIQSLSARRSMSAPISRIVK